jgi:hypothetical protein
MNSNLDMPPRWGLCFVGDTACYKHVAPLALPPIKLQREFARRVTAVEAPKTAQRAFRGQL